MKQSNIAQQPNPNNIPTIINTNNGLLAYNTLVFIHRLNPLKVKHFYLLSTTKMHQYHQNTTFHQSYAKTALQIVDKKSDNERTGIDTA